MASGFMSLIAVFVGYNTAKEFGGTPILGGAVAAVIVFPGVTHITAFGQHLSPGQGGVLGALAAALLAVQVEKRCRKAVPEALDVLLTPTVTVLVTGLVTLFGLMYLAGEAATAIGTGANWLLAHGGAFAGFLLGGLFLPLVMLGLHQALIPLHTTLIEQQGYTVLLPILAMAGAGQVGAAIAVYLRLPHNRSIRRTIKSALPAGFLGVGEPLIYGVSLPLGRPFITACLGGAAAWRLRRPLQPTRRRRRLHRHRPLRLGPVPPGQGQPATRHHPDRLRPGAGRRLPRRLPRHLLLRPQQTNAAGTEHSPGQHPHPRAPRNLKARPDIYGNSHGNPHPTQNTDRLESTLKSTATTATATPVTTCDNHNNSQAHNKVRISPSPQPRRRPPRRSGIKFSASESSTTPPDNTRPKDAFTPKQSHPRQWHKNAAGAAPPQRGGAAPTNRWTRDPGGSAV